MYVRGGAFIPRIPPIQNTGLYSLKSFELHFYFDETVKESEGHLYNDDGETPNAFEKGKYEMLTFESEFKNDKLHIEIEQKLGSDFEYSSKEMNLIVHNVSSKPKKVKGHNFEWNKENNTLTVLISLKNSKTKNLKIKF